MLTSVIARPQRGRGNPYFPHKGTDFHRKRRPVGDTFFGMTDRKAICNTPFVLFKFICL